MSDNEDAYPLASNNRPLRKSRSKSGVPYYLNDAEAKIEFSGSLTNLNTVLAPNPHLPDYEGPGPILNLPSQNQGDRYPDRKAQVAAPFQVLRDIESFLEGRDGSVLSKGMILKTDHFRTGRNNNLDLHLLGATNFRSTDLDVYGVGQPAIVGLCTILNLLGCSPPRSVSSSPVHQTPILTKLDKSSKNKSLDSLDFKGPKYPPTKLPFESEKSQERQTNCAWFNMREEPVIYINGRSFVLRESENPLQNLKLLSGINSARLEEFESRLKRDILVECEKYNGLILIHDELDDGNVVPGWIAANDVQTPREVYESLQKQGYRVTYTRVPISPEQAPEDEYLDVFVDVLQKTRPEDSVVVNCGMGIGRTTFAMAAALLFRRAQRISLGLSDPYPSPVQQNQEEVTIALSELQNRTTLRLVYVLERGLKSKMSPHSAIEWALAHGKHIQNLRDAILGNYDVIVKLVSVLADGNQSKRVVDTVIDKCDTLVNLREIILMHRIRQYPGNDPASLEKSLACLERYFYLLTFSSYVQEAIKSQGFQTRFSSWLHDRTEIYSRLEKLRTKKIRLNLFRPVQDLSESFSVMGSGGKNNVSEFENYIIMNRNGTVLGPKTILKIDHWMESLASTDSNIIAGAPNFRKIHEMDIYGVGQPTVEGFRKVFNRVLLESIDKTLCWLNLREEPLIYIDGDPYVLRDEYATLRNLKQYSGITAERLEAMEQRLKEDVLAEHSLYHSILVHDENNEGLIFSRRIRGAVKVQTLREVIEMLQSEFSFKGIVLDYKRIPLTAEETPEACDFDDILTVINAKGWNKAAFILNCQVGMGRSTTGTVIASLVMRYFDELQRTDMATLSNSALSASCCIPITASRKQSDSYQPQGRKQYRAIANLLRVITNGLECQQVVDEAVEKCASFMNLYKVIEECRIEAEKNKNSTSQRKRFVRKGLEGIKRYFYLIAFESYLFQLAGHPSSAPLESFTDYIKSHKEFATMLEMLESMEIQALYPITFSGERESSTEYISIVNVRRGSVLAPQTILKSDHFPGCQKKSLQFRIDGAPNFRKVPLTVRAESEIVSHPEKFSYVYGVAMPKKPSIRNVLDTVGAGPKGTRTLIWNCLREEPALFVRGKPFVLRNIDNPLKNIETTGIARERVESMEIRMKNDAIKELQLNGGKLLLHDEESLSDTPGEITSVWEVVEETDIETPKEIFENIVTEGYRVIYHRIPITDEQAPISSVFDEFYNLSKQLKSGTDLIFNCQMGRGRTTTGMATAFLIRAASELLAPIVERDDGTITDWDLVNLEEDLQNPFSSRKNSEIATPLPPDTIRVKTPKDDEEKETLMRGEYKIIVHLVTILKYGKIAKLLTDKTLDTVQHIQNLREAIYVYKLELEHLQSRTTMTSSAPDNQNLERAINYLARYFYLITFANFVIEDILEHKGSKLFSEWLADRKEIINLITNVSSARDFK